MRRKKERRKEEINKFSKASKELSILYPLCDQKLKEMGIQQASFFSIVYKMQWMIMALYICVYYLQNSRHIHSHIDIDDDEQV